MATKATPWPQMIRAIYASFGTGDHSNDAHTRRIMDRIVSWLVKGKELSPALQKSLLLNIQQRTSFAGVDPEAPIRLTANQIKYARRTNPEWFGLDSAIDDEGEWRMNDGSMESEADRAGPFIPLPLPDLSSTIIHLFTHLCTTFPPQGPALVEQMASIAAEMLDSREIFLPPFIPKDKIMEDKKRNHESDMIPAFADDLASPGHDMKGLSMELSIQGADRDDSCSHSFPQAPTTARRATHDGMDDGNAKSRAPKQPTITLWVKTDDRGDRHATGYLELGDERYALRFTGFDHALERIGDTPENHGWFRYMAKDVAEMVLPQERAHTGIAGRATMSGLYDKGDTWARKEPVMANAAIVLVWQDDEPAGARLIIGEEHAIAMFKREAKDRFKAVLQ